MIKHLDDNIKNYRSKAGLTQEELAKKSGIAYSTITKLERGAIKDPSFSTMLSIAKALGTPVDQFANHKSGKRRPSSDGDIKFVYCDVNGVLVRFFQKAFVTMAQECHRNPDTVETAFWHYNAAANKGEMTLDEFNQAVASRLRVKKIDWEKHYFAAIEPVKAMHECLKEISKDVEVGLLTNIMPGFVPEMIKAGLIPDIEYAAIVDSSEVDAVKPEAEIYSISEKMANYSGSEILFIDDSRTNLMEAEKLGWRVLWFDDYRPAESVKRVKAALKS